MGGAVFLSCWLFGLRHSRTGACRLLGSTRSWCQNGNLWESSSQSIFSGSSATSVLAPPHSDPEPIPTSPGDPPRLIGRSSPSSYGITALFWVPVYMKPCVCPPRVESLFPSVLWSSCTQAPLVFKAKCSGIPPPDARSSAWGA